jgi:hypothetical protein
MEHRKLIKTPDAESLLSIEINSSARDVYYYLERMGGDNGWYSYDSIFRLQNAIGKGKPRLRSLDVHVYNGSKIDFFKVEDYKKDEMLLLSFKAVSIIGENSFYLKVMDNGKTMFTNEMRLKFTSSVGRSYWKLISPFDRILRKKMLSNIKKFTENSDF